MKSARRVAVILWMTLLCRSNDRAGRRDFEPSSPGLGSFNAKNSTLLGCCFFALKKRETGIEPATPSLARRCSTTEPLARIKCKNYYTIRLSCCQQFFNFLNFFDFFILISSFHLSVQTNPNLPVLSLHL